MGQSIVRDVSFYSVRADELHRWIRCCSRAACNREAYLRHANANAAAIAIAAWDTDIKAVMGHPRLSRKHDSMPSKGQRMVYGAFKRRVNE